MSTPLILTILVIGLAIYAVSLYNTLQRLMTQITASIQEIGNQLKRQASLIPNLESSVKSFLKHEGGIFKLLTDARKSVTQAASTNSLPDVEKAATAMQALIPKINIMVEDNPELKSNETVTQFMRELTDTADKLMYARRSLIDLTQNFNEKLVVFPSNLIAGIFGFKQQQGLQTPQSGQHVEVSSDEMKDVKVNI
ncbi:MAG: hypothetical protein A2632_01145 [Candidatus Pacebacteria bacterium RIFCSPHIGHO2_01_FULL_46_16]|nr:MAG: hypothetical protein A2632_01145 [Candidatus Pacebacteria bacterium RIFCSPHIGHO2_01_FULL_46_16]OGJ20090.1 MAG: hypothetical protein A3J60_01005 [Candidatus Pacebacteria bacterium RIFCSPHIGHO2_02_FULL_46_9]